jgi:hypothetical protein
MVADGIYSNLADSAPDEIGLLPSLVLMNDGLGLISLGRPDYVSRDETTGVITAFWRQNADSTLKFLLTFSSNGHWD